MGTGKIEPSGVDVLRLQTWARGEASSAIFGTSRVRELMHDERTGWLAAGVVAAHPGRFSDDLVAEAEAVVEVARQWNQQVLERAGRLFESFEELGIRWAVAGMPPASDASGVRLDPLRLLVHPYDAPRVRVSAVAHGCRRAGEGRLAVRFRCGELNLVLETGLHPRGWAPLPLSPFLETAQQRDQTPGRWMTDPAAWAAQRLRVARDLWHPASVDLDELMMLIQLGAMVDDEDRDVWRRSAGRWGVGKLWRRCGELESWLGGGPRPAWLDPICGTAQAGSGAIPAGWPPFGMGLALQDGPGRKVAYLVRRLIGR